MKRRGTRLQKPQAIRKGSRLGVVFPSSPAEEATLAAGIAELRRLGFAVEEPERLKQQGYFAAGHVERLQNFCKTIHDKNIDGVIAARGGYGANYLIDQRLATRLRGPKVVVGYSDLNALQLMLGEVRQWAGFYGPMVAAGLNRGANGDGGYDEESFLLAVGETKRGWVIPLHGETMREGTATGRIVGGCLTMLQTTLGTGWEPDTEGAILLLEDRGMKPYQVDRALRHLWQAGKLRDVNGIVLGDFPECEPPMAGSTTVREVCEAILAPLKVPIVYGAPVGHTKRAMLTVPLGVKAKLQARGKGTLEILEPAVTE